MRATSVQVVCSDCGKTLAGFPTVSGNGFHVSRHRRKDSTLWCWGSKRTNHTPVSVPS